MTIIEYAALYVIIATVTGALFSFVDHLPGGSQPNPKFAVFMGFLWPFSIPMFVICVGVAIGQRLARRATEKKS